MKQQESPPAWTQEAYRCCVESTPSVVLTEFHPSHPDLAWGGRGYPTWVLPGRVPPILTGGLTYLGPPSRQGIPPVLTWQGVPYLDPPGRVPPGRVTPGRVPTWQGAPPQLDLVGYPPRCLPHLILGNVAKHYGIWVPPGVCPMAFWVMLQSIMGYGYPPMDGQTDTCQNITFPLYYVRGR